MSSRRSRRFVLLLVLAAAPAVARAQVGSNTDILSGRITAPDGKGVAGATVTAVSLDTRATPSRPALVRPSRSLP